MDSTDISANSTINADTRGLSWSSATANELSAEIPFVDEGNCDFRLKENSLIFQRIPGFESIPFMDIGLLTER